MKKTPKRLPWTVYETTASGGTQSYDFETREEAERWQATRPWLPSKIYYSPER